MGAAFPNVVCEISYLHLASVRFEISFRYPHCRELV